VQAGGRVSFFLGSKNKKSWGEEISMERWQCVDAENRRESVFNQPKNEASTGTKLRSKAKSREQSAGRLSRKSLGEKVVPFRERREE